MQHHLQAPKQRLAEFREKLGIEPGPHKALARHAGALAVCSAEFAQYLQTYFMTIPETQVILTHQSRPGQMRNNWQGWFESLFRRGPDDEFLASLWQSGLMHVQVSIDQRWINLGYSLARQFLRKTVQQTLPESERADALEHVDTLVDLCVLVATDAYLAATTKCDREVIMGIAHQVRNPITIIGGNINRLKRLVQGHVESCEVCDTILFESLRLERMMRNLGDYIDIFQRQPKAQPVALEGLLLAAHEKAQKDLHHPPHKLEMALDQNLPEVFADPRDLEALFFHLLHNAMEAMEELPEEERLLRVSSELEGHDNRYLRITVFNTGVAPAAEDIPNLLRPFHSTRAMGTGFGLPIARLAALKSLGGLVLTPQPDGLACQVTLSISAELQVHQKHATSA